MSRRSLRAMGYIKRNLHVGRFMRCAGLIASWLIAVGCLSAAGQENDDAAPVVRRPVVPGVRRSAGSRAAGERKAAARVQRNELRQAAAEEPPADEPPAELPPAKDSPPAEMPADEAIPQSKPPRGRAPAASRPDASPPTVESAPPHELLSEELEESDLPDDCCVCGGRGNCSFCGGCSSGGAFGLGVLNGFYVRMEYLAWATKGMNVPPLLTTSPDGTPAASAGVLGQNGTTVLLGNSVMNGGGRNGGRITMGGWLDPCRKWGVEGDYFALNDKSTQFFRSSTGSPILAQPFIDSTDGLPNADLIAIPTTHVGSFAANIPTRFQGTGVRGLYNLCCWEGCGARFWDGCPTPSAKRIDFLFGYRFLRLDDGIDTQTNVTLSAPAPAGSFISQDSFRTKNQFSGFDLGTVMQFRRARWSLDLTTKFAIGDTHSVISIAGNTVITNPTASTVTTNTGGILAQRTNIGTYTRNSFSMVPELNLLVGYQLTPVWRATCGYTLIYWSRVYRAGDQIDLTVNPNLFPPEANPFTGALRPAFLGGVATDYWATGVSAGMEARW